MLLIALLMCVSIVVMVPTDDSRESDAGLYACAQLEISEGSFWR